MLFLALIGTLYPYNRGALLNWLVLLYALFSVFAGYTAASFHGQYAENGWVILYAISQERKRNVKCFSFDVTFKNNGTLTPELFYTHLTLPLATLPFLFLEIQKLTFVKTILLL